MKGVIVIKATAKFRNVLHVYYAIMFIGIM